MNGNELDQLYDGLLDLLRTQELGWVADQVIEEITLGNTIQRNYRDLESERRAIKLFDIDVADASPVRRSSREDVFVTEPYSQEDRLRVLLDAIEEAVVHSGAMSVHLFDGITSDQNDISFIEFYSEDTNIEPVRIDRQSALARIEANARLKEQLRRLRLEL